MGDELAISEFFPDKRYKMLFGQQDVPMNKIFVGVTFIGYWEYLMDNLDQIDIGKKLTWDPCDAPSPTDNPEEYGVPLPFYRMGFLPRDPATDTPKKKKDLISAPETDVPPEKLPFL